MEPDGKSITFIALIAGVVFAVIQLRQYREARQREAALEFLRSFQSQQMTTALRLVFGLPYAGDLGPRDHRRVVPVAR